MERTLKLDDEIRLVEERIAGGRTRLGRTADQLGDTARDAVASPGVMLAAVAMGFVLGSLTRRPRATAAAAGTGLGGLLMAALLPLARMAYATAVETFWNQTELATPRRRGSRAAERRSAGAPGQAPGA
jgi:hypothetical protein